jgi:hypothetical protein
MNNSNIDSSMAQRKFIVDGTINKRRSQAVHISAAFVMSHEASSACGNISPILSYNQRTITERVCSELSMLRTQNYTLLRAHVRYADAGIFQPLWVLFWFISEWAASTLKKILSVHLWLTHSLHLWSFVSHFHFPTHLSTVSVCPSVQMIQTPV